MFGSFVFHGKKFANIQVWGCILILIGAIISSQTYATGDGSSNLSLPFVFLYIFSLIPSAASNLYKERKMKEENLNEIHTSTIVTFWQMVIGFFFLPIISVIYFNKISYADMYDQISDGFVCFIGDRNPQDPQASCKNAAKTLIAYVIVNFIYNVLLLSITKNGSAVLLVVSQVLYYCTTVLYCATAPISSI